MKVLVLGSGGFLGSYMGFALPQLGLEVCGLSRKPAPYFPDSAVWSSVEDIADTVSSNSVDVVINAVALASHEECEKNPAEAFRLNAALPGEWARQCAEQNVGFVHISTDAVFDGEGTKPLNEHDEPRPLGVYGASKLQGEQAVAAAHSGAVIARTNFFGWSRSGKKGVLDFFHTAMSDKVAITGFTDYRVSSVYMGHLVAALFEAVAFGATGIHHIVADKALSKFDFGLAVAEEFGLDSSSMKPGLLVYSGALTERGRNLELSTRQIESILGRPMESVREGLAQAKKEKSALMDYFGKSERRGASHEN